VCTQVGHAGEDPAEPVDVLMAIHMGGLQAQATHTVVLRMKLGGDLRRRNTPSQESPGQCSSGQKTAIRGQQGRHVLRRSHWLPPGQIEMKPDAKRRIRLGKHCCSLSSRCIHHERRTGDATDRMGFNDPLSGSVVKSEIIRVYDEKPHVRLKKSYPYAI